MGKTRSSNCVANCSLKYQILIFLSVITELEDDVYVPAILENS